MLRLFKSAGIQADIDIGTALDTAFTNVYDAIDGVKHIPVIWENIGPPPVAGLQPRALKDGLSFPCRWMYFSTAERWCYAISHETGAKPDVLGRDNTGDGHG